MEVEAGTKHDVGSQHRSIKISKIIVLMRDSLKVLEFIPNKPLQTNKKTKHDHSILNTWQNTNWTGYDRRKPLPRYVTKVERRPVFFFTVRRCAIIASVAPATKKQTHKWRWQSLPGLDAKISQSKSLVGLSPCSIAPLQYHSSTSQHL